MQVYHTTPAKKREGTPEGAVYLVPAAEAESAKAPGLAEMAKIEDPENPGTRFESHPGFDYACVLAVSPSDPLAGPVWLRALLKTDSLTLVYQPCSAVQKLAEKLKNTAEDAVPAPQQALLLFFALLTQDDAAALEDIEEEIADFEDALVDALPKDSAGRISELRRRLLALKRYYEGLFDLLEDMEENANGLLSHEQLRALHLQTNRADRLSRAVLNLRDYVTQVREAYQNQLDIGLNQIMKVFTVVTSVFLPLTLIVGWYGMNLQMPEYDLSWGYPAVIALSAVVLGICVWLFKKNKWF